MTKLQEDKTIKWMRDFSIQMSLMGITLPKELDDVNAVCKAIKDAFSQQKVDIEREIEKMRTQKPNFAGGYFPRDYQETIYKKGEEYGHNKIIDDILSIIKSK